MKKSKRITSVLVLLLMTISISSIFSQDDDKRRGIRIGFASTEISNSSGNLIEDNYNSFYGGVFNEVDLSRFFRFSTGLEYVQIGSSMDDDNEVKVSFLSLPVSAKLKLAGLFGRIGVGANMRIGNSEVLDGQEADPTVLDYNRFMFNSLFGIGAKLGFIEFEFRYHKGLSDVVDGFSSEYFQFGVNVLF